MFPTQILYLILDDQIILYKFFKRRQPLMEGNIQTSNYQKFNIYYWIILDNTRILNLRLDYQNEIYKSLK